MRNLKEAVEVEDHVQADRKEDEDSSGSAEEVKRQDKTKMIKKERIERLKKTFRPNLLRDIIDNSENGIKGKITK